MAINLIYNYAGFIFINTDLLESRLHGSHLLISNDADFMVISADLLECRLHGYQHWSELECCSFHGSHLLSVIMQISCLSEQWSVFIPNSWQSSLIYMYNHAWLSTLICCYADFMAIISDYNYSDFMVNSNDLLLCRLHGSHVLSVIMQVSWLSGLRSVLSRLYDNHLWSVICRLHGYHDWCVVIQNSWLSTTVYCYADFMVIYKWPEIRMQTSWQ